MRPNPNLIQQSPAKIKPKKSLHFLRRIERYQGITLTPKAFYFCAASRLERGHERRRRCPFARVVLFLTLHFEFLWPFERGEGHHSKILIICKEFS
jgi:hypothetical protein